MRIQLDQIKVSNRIRKDLGDLGPLIDSLRRVGQLQPILIDGDNRLICGFRRLEAARQLGWDSLDTRQIDIDSKHDLLLMEAEENTARKNFNPAELERIDLLLNRHSRRGIFWKIFAFFLDLLDRIFGR
ncbi:MAG: ParB N-terminal domain-containing protein [Leptospiraceae bacterium]|nr:ParB N-terminal domain-containing protein [Leptospiraceae bacterium]